MKESTYLLLMGAISVAIVAVWATLWQNVNGAIACMMGFNFFSWTVIIMLLKKQEPDKPQAVARDDKVEAELKKIISK